MEKIYFKSTEHKESSQQFLELFGKEDFLGDVEYGTVAYIFGALSYKFNDLISVIDDDQSLDVGKLYELIDVYSSSERNMIRFAMQCFNSNIDDICLNDVLYSLDNENALVIKTAIEIRYFKRFM